jgi:hypothetical protein
MKNSCTKLMVGATFIFLAGLMVAPQTQAAKESGVYYTKLNMWYEHPEKIFSTNYHVGEMLPVGTEVEIVKRGRKKILFRDTKSGSKYRLIHIKDYTNISSDALFERYFSKTSVLESDVYKAFSELEKDAIKRGELNEGMTKDAVMMAYGYPPTHRTPSLSDSHWTYWVNRWKNFMIRFEGDIVSVVP